MKVSFIPLLKSGFSGDNVYKMSRGIDDSMPRDPLSLVTYCGLYCGLCAQRTNVPKQARQLRISLHEEGFDDFYKFDPYLKQVFPVFWRYLNKLETMRCSCRAGGGDPKCPIRDCARERGIDVCPQCEKYPCKLIVSLSQRYPILIEDGYRLQQVGITKWIKEQKERSKRGFTYSQIRR